MATLYVSDLDGTLLGNDSRVSAATADIINDLTARGAMVTVATARTIATVVPLLEGIDMSVPAIVMTGTATYDLRAGRYIEMARLRSDECVAVERECRAVGLTPFVYTHGDDYILKVYHDAPALNNYEDVFVAERSNLKLKHFYLNTPTPREAEDRTILYFAIDRREAVEHAVARLRACTSLSVSCYTDNFNRDVGMLDVYAPGVNKAAAILRVKEQCGADRVVVFGDNLNDLSMLAVADVAVAVDNALPEVKEAADIVIGRNSADSVARFIADDFSHYQ